MTELGEALPGIEASELASAKKNFQTPEDITQGLGPVFNERACGNCHVEGAVGGGGGEIQHRFGSFTRGAFDPLAREGGPLRHLYTLGTFNNPHFHGGPPDNPTLCTVPLEREPSDATVHDVGRVATPLFGLGLVDAMPDSFFEMLSTAEPPGTRGIARRERVLLPMVKFEPGTSAGVPQQSVGSVRVARFGWKAQIPTLQQFAADAYLNEMGITTQSCVVGVSDTHFSMEPAPNGHPEPLGCDDEAPPAPAGVPPGTDEYVGPCAPGQTAIQRDLANFAKFITFLAPPPRDEHRAAAAEAGQVIFGRIGCASCHVDPSVTSGALASASRYKTPPVTPNGVSGDLIFHPFSDFLVHDVGTLGDRTGVDPGESVEQTRRMRTAPLWGIRFRKRLLHDGRVADIASAVRAHDGQAAASRDLFNQLDPSSRQAVVAFVRSL